VCNVHDVSTWNVYTHGYRRLSEASRVYSISLAILNANNNGVNEVNIRYLTVDNSSQTMAVAVANFILSRTQAQTVRVIVTCTILIRRTHTRYKLVRVGLRLHVRYDEFFTKNNTERKYNENLGI